ncbi:hypothetical protein HBH56_149440 [Parastagonospora nodorum]|uniref:Uncharacterized protein n=1 Tax=Phaeosphaeria nodorum (strain SN15 / ATCC MYA-4574 / FGSC 10173) TaxID=321614 RepID=A0A7U2HXE3_PHANO|nr:hypothetical protein HBH56_149440 [Parastagonospora nodorum]QRC94183.1 hypothetical protein JI435_074550 [Parastagonospora nodorum SN15]KAH3928487.1 hypothetical protein HBH54_135340 [Parastagonospora nodorum]KAH3946161.1 hypothetical protein HBH53_136890 [Parastagonospora nodorum]KAH3983964.1 hypothetical protein HBH52_063120 [Parastagonospora nodorum]
MELAVLDRIRYVRHPLKNFGGSHGINAGTGLLLIIVLLICISYLDDVTAVRVLFRGRCPAIPRISSATEIAMMCW